MSAQIRRTNDRSKLVEQESGRRLYATDLPYEEAMDQTTQKYLDSVKLVKQSEFKKPYREDDYGTMEYGGDVKIPPWKFTPINPGPGLDPGCKPRCIGAGGGSGGEWYDCKDNDCAVFIFECCSKIKNFGCGNCKVEVIRNLELDQCSVKVCGAKGKDSLQINYETAEELAKAHQGRTCCSATGISIGYTSQQMSCSGTQALTALPATDADSCWIWSLSGGGSLSATSGASVIYTAPATNANCANNATITLTNDKGATATLQIAVNCVSDPAEWAIWENAWDGTQAGWSCGAGAHVWQGKRLSCDGTLYGLVGNCSSCDCVPTGQCIQDPTCTSPSIQATCCDHTEACADGVCAVRMKDVRSAAAKANGCCPAALL